MLDPILEQILSKTPDTATADFEVRRDGFLAGQQYEADQHREMRMHCAKVEDELLRLKKDYDALKEKYEAPLDGSFDVCLAWRQLDVPTLHPHDFRHSGATLLKNAGMSLEDVATLLSHESTDTTRKFYIKQDTARISTMKSLYNI